MRAEGRAVGRRSRTQVDLPVVVRHHHAAPRLAEEQGREALSFGLDLQRSATALAPEHARIAREEQRRRRILRWSRRVGALDLVAAAAAVAAWSSGWPLGGR